jgi:predicted dehydrogenase
MRVLSVGVIGYGVVGKRRIQHILDNKNLKLKYVSDIEFKKNFTKKKVNYFINYLDLIKKKPNIVFVTLPNYLAPKVTKLCLKNKIHVFCEKPPGRSVSDIKSVINQEKLNKKIKLKYGFNHRYHGSVQKAKNIIDNKTLGNILNIRGVYGKSKIVTFGKNEWRSSRKEAGGGILLDQGIHMLDLICFFAGKFNKFKSFVSNKFWKYNVEDSAFALMKNDTGIIASIHSTATQWKHKFNIEITLEKATLILSGILSGSKSYGQEKLIILHKKNGKFYKKTFTFYKDNSWKQEIKEFTDIILKNKKVLNGNSLQALEVMIMIHSIYNNDIEWKKKINDKK